MKKFILGWLVVVIIITACPEGDVFSPKDVLRLGDNIIPQIILDTPGNNTPYTSIVTVSGRVMDFATPGGEPGKVFQLECEVSDLGKLPNIDFDEDGYFSFTFSTNGLSGSLLLSLWAVDWNRNTSDKLSVTLREGAIPSFRATPGNGGISLDWEDVPLATNYTLYYLDKESGVSELNYSGIIPDAMAPCVVDGLENGRYYSFLLIAHSPGGEDDFSPLRRAFPLSPFTLAPRLSAEYGQLRVEWESISATERFVVLRCMEFDGTFTPIVPQHSGNVYIDSDVIPGETYYYKIAAALQPELVSAAGHAMVSPLAPFLEVCGGYSATPALVSLAVSGTLALAGDVYGVLHVFDLSLPPQPAELASWQAAGNILDIALEGSTAYLAVDGEGLQIVDLSLPAKPRLMGFLDTEGNARGVAVSGDRLYLSAGSAGLQIIDISDPLSPRQIKPGWSIEEETAYAVALRGDYAYVAYGKAGLQIVNIAASDNPFRIGQYPGYPAYSLVLSGDTCYLASGTAGLKIIDISDPAHPGFAGPLGDDITRGNIRDIAMQGTFAMLAGESGGLEVIDTSQAYYPTYGGCYTAAGIVSAVAVAGRYTYAATSAAGLVVLDTAYPAVTLPATGYQNGIDISDLCIRGDYAYLANRENGLTVLDLSHPGPPDYLGGRRVSGSATNLALLGEYVFLTGSGMGLQILDVSVPASPSFVGGYSLEGNTAGMHLQGDYAYISYWNDIASFHSGLYILDISRPESPTLEGCYLSQDGSARSVKVKGEYAYLANKEGGLALINITDKTNPALSNADITKAAAGDSGLAPLKPLEVVIADQDAYLAAGYAGLALCNITNPQLPQSLVTLERSGNSGACTQGLFRIKDYLFCADGMGGMQISGRSSEAGLFHISTYNPTPVVETENLYIAGAYAYLAAGSSGLIVLDLWCYD